MNESLQRPVDVIGRIVEMRRQPQRPRPPCHVNAGRLQGLMAGLGPAPVARGE